MVSTFVTRLINEIRNLEIVVVAIAVLYTAKMIGKRNCIKIRNAWLLLLISANFCLTQHSCKYFQEILFILGSKDWNILAASVANAL